MNQHEPFGSRTLFRGKQGADVIWLQQFLGLKADGVFGPATDAAVRQWQSAAGLRPDGIIGPITAAKMEAGHPPAAPDAPAPEAAPSGPVVLTPDLVRRGFPDCRKPDEWQAALDLAFSAFPEFNKKGAACILAMAKTETGGLTRWDENLNYSDPRRITATFGARAGKDIASLLMNPRALGDQVYGPIGGYAARGGGIIQLTGLENQEAFAKWAGMSLDGARDYFRTIQGAAMTGPFYYRLIKKVAALNSGDMLAAIAGGLGKTKEAVQAPNLWDVIHGDRRMMDYHLFVDLLG